MQGKRDYDYIYGSKVIIQCQAKINIEPWKNQKEYLGYLAVIKKDNESDFFRYWCKLRDDVICVVDTPPHEELDSNVLQIVGTHMNAYLKEMKKRVFSWSKDIKIKNPSIVSGSAHRKHLIKIPFDTFCARDQGINFRVPKYTSSSAHALIHMLTRS